MHVSLFTLPKYYFNLISLPLLSHDFWVLLTLAEVKVVFCFVAVSSVAETHFYQTFLLTAAVSAES